MRKKENIEIVLAMLALLAYIIACEKPSCGEIVQVRDSAIIYRTTDNTLRYLDTVGNFNLGQIICP